MFKSSKGFEKLSKAIFLVALLWAPSAFAAACCGGSGVIPSLITGDDAAQLTAGASQGMVIGDAPEQGKPVFRHASHHETTRLTRLDGALVLTGLTDRLQLGATISAAQREVARSSRRSSATGLGDAQLAGAYEVLPEWSYSPWKPRGYVFSQVTFPTGVSVYESKEANAVDATGKGFFTVGAGALFLKRWTVWDLYSLFEIRRSLPRTFQLNGESTQIDPGLGGSLGIGVGVSPWAGRFRAGLRLQPSYGQSRTIRAAGIETKSSSQRAWDSALELSYMIHEEWSVLATYVDQTLLGPAQNSTLSRTVSASLQKRWMR